MERKGGRERERKRERESQRHVYCFLKAMFSLTTVNFKTRDIEKPHTNTKIINTVTRLD